MPLFGSIQMDGAIIWFEVSAVMTLETTSFSRQSEFAGAHAIDGDAQRRIVEVLRDIDVGDVGQAAHFALRVFSRSRNRQPCRCR